MELALKIVSWIAIVIGALAVIGGLADASIDPDYMYVVIGGGIYLAMGVLALSYMNKYPQEKK